MLFKCVKFSKFTIFKNTYSKIVNLLKKQDNIFYINLVFLPINFVIG